MKKRDRKHTAEVIHILCNKAKPDWIWIFTPFLGSVLIKTSPSLFHV